MDSRIRREALRAAAKLAFGTISSVVVVGCGGKTDFSRDVSTEDGARTDLRGWSDAACTYPATVVLADSSQNTAHFTKAELECCVAHVEARTAAPSSASAGDPQLESCCNAIITAVDVGMMTYSAVQGGVREACCFSGTQGDQQSRWNHNLCAPWGPPVPPEMDWFA
jgi:hypothetical protein